MVQGLFKSRLDLAFVAGDKSFSRQLQNETYRDNEGTSPHLEQAEVPV
jgi:hypothetical protein